eukprot:g2098.t1
MTCFSPGLVAELTEHLLQRCSMPTPAFRTSSFLDSTAAVAEPAAFEKFGRELVPPVDLQRAISAYGNLSTLSTATKAKSLFDGTSGNFNEANEAELHSLSQNKIEDIGDYLAGSRKSSSDEPYYKMTLQEPTGPDVLVRGTEVGARPGGGLQHTYKANEALSQFLMEVPDLPVDGINAFQKFMGKFTNALSLPNPREGLNQLSIQSMLATGLPGSMGANVPKDGMKLVEKFTDDIGPDVINRAGKTKDFIKKLSVYALSKVVSVVQTLSPVTISTEPEEAPDAEPDSPDSLMPGEAGEGGEGEEGAGAGEGTTEGTGEDHTKVVIPPAKKKVKIELKGAIKDIADAMSGPMSELRKQMNNMKEVVAGGLKFLLSSSLGWKIYPAALMAWPAYFMLQAYRAYATMGTRQAAAWNFGMKIMVDWQSPVIASTDLWDLTKWTCQKKGNRVLGGLKSLVGRGHKDLFTTHPSIAFRTPQDLVHVTLKVKG